MKTVTQILRAKPDMAVHTVAPDASALDAAHLMAEKNIGALLVTEGETIVGIVSERDYARKTAKSDRTPRNMSVREIMSAPVRYVSPQQTTDDCMALMTNHRLRHLPVLEDGKLVGLISIGDLVKDIISEQGFMIEQLQQYITS